MVISACRASCSRARSMTWCNFRWSTARGGSSVRYSATRMPEASSAFPILLGQAEEVKEVWIAENQVRRQAILISQGSKLDADDLFRPLADCRAFKDHPLDLVLERPGTPPLRAAHFGVELAFQRVVDGDQFAKVGPRQLCPQCGHNSLVREDLRKPDHAKQASAVEPSPVSCQSRQPEIAVVVLRGAPSIKLAKTLRARASRSGRHPTDIALAGALIEVGQPALTQPRQPHHKARRVCYRSRLMIRPSWRLSRHRKTSGLMS